MSEIHFFKEDCHFDLRKLRKHKKWLMNVAASYKLEIVELNYIFCSDEYLYRMNLEYLNHDTYTDIITFDMGEPVIETKKIESDIFISIDRIKDNAQSLGTAFSKELLRVMAHGLLHIIGFADKTEQEQQKMRSAENSAIELF